MSEEKQRIAYADMRGGPGMNQSLRCLFRSDVVTYSRRPLEPLVGIPKRFEMRNAPGSAPPTPWPAILVNLERAVPIPDNAGPPANRVWIYFDSGGDAFLWMPADELDG